jgi:exonuclease SbcC
LDRQRKTVELASKHVAHTLELRAISDLVALKGKQFKALSDQLTQAEGQEAEGRKARFQDLAGSLAEDLLPETACPVCGSPDHPAPAQPGESSITQQEMEAFSERVEGLKAEKETAQGDWSSEQRRHEHIKGQRVALEPVSTPLAELKQQLVDLETGFQSVQADRSLQELEAEVPGLQEQVKSAETASIKAYGASMSAKQALKGERSLLQEAEGRLPAELGSLAQIKAHSVQVVARIKSIGEALAAAQEKHTETVAVHGQKTEALNQERKQAEKAKTTFASAQTQWSEALEKAGFSSLEAWQAAKITGAEQDGMEARLTQAKAVHLAAVNLEARTRLAAEKVQSVGDLSEKKQAVAQARLVRDQALQRLALFEQTVERFRGVFTQVKDLKAKGGAIEARYAIAGQLADVAKGKNPAKLDFERYVLGVMLDEVLQSAAFRLQAMSRGRYTLHRALALEDGRRVAGLDLDIMDHWTGHARSAATLSGGEGFLAALALALGLADVIQSTTGGIHLEAVFIDEGFGSLDPEALEMAMRALEDLRQSGRMVGLISHVAELKERIDTRIEVKRGRNGSRIQLVRS